MSSFIYYPKNETHLDFSVYNCCANQCYICVINVEAIISKAAINAHEYKALRESGRESNNLPQTA